MAGEVPENTQQQSAAPDNTAEAPAPGAPPGAVLPAAPEPRLSRRDASLREFLSQIDDFAPIVCFSG